MPSCPKCFSRERTLLAVSSAGQDAIDGGDGYDFDLRRGQHHADGPEVVDAPVGIDNHMVTCFIMGQRRLQEQQGQQDYKDSFAMVRFIYV